jgi:hypothetical protein
MSYREMARCRFFRVYSALLQQLCHVKIF